MSAEQSPAAQPQAATRTEEATSLLDGIINTMPKTVRESEKRTEVEELLQVFAQQALQGTVQYDKSLMNTFDQAIAQIDAMLSKQVAAVMHNEKFQKLEGSWRGVKYMTDNSETCRTLKLKLMHVSKKELGKDLEKATEFDQSQVFKKIYTSEFGQAGGEPFGTLLGDYEFGSHPQDIALLDKMAEVAAAGFCPFISAAGPQMFGFDSYEELNRPRDLEKIFEGKDYIKWRAFREKEDSRFVVLTMPRVLARLPFGAATKPIDEFSYEEAPSNEKGEHVELPHDQYTWMNCAYALGARLTDAFSKTNWCTTIRGYENGGTVENLPVHVFTSEEGDREIKCPTEVLIPDRRDAELSKLGFLALCNYKNTDFSVFFGGQTTQKPKKYDDPNASANAEISARLPYMLATGRIAHFLKCAGRDKLGSFMERDDLEDWLNRWIKQYVLADEKPKPDMKAKYPLAAAQITVAEIPGKPGAYNVVAHLRPWLQLEELNASLRMVAAIPKTQG